MSRSIKLSNRRPSDSSPEGKGLAIPSPDGDVPHAAAAAAATGMRYLMGRLQLNDPAGLPSRLALTAALSGEGTTFISRTLAAAIAHDLGRSVCLVDLNWWSEEASPRRRRARRGESDELPHPQLGIGDVVDGDIDLDRILQPTSNEHLWIAPSGRVEPALRPVLARDEALDRVIDDLAGRFQHLVIDLPPVLVTSDTLTLVRLADAYALVVRQGVTTQAQVRDSIDELRGAVSVGVVLNRASSRIPRSVQKLIAR